MNWYNGLARIQEVEQQAEKVDVNVGKVECRESIVGVAGRVFEYRSVNSQSVKLQFQFQFDFNQFLTL